MIIVWKSKGENGMSKVNKCKFCGKVQDRPLSKGYCVSCYQYFIMHGYDSYYPSQFGELARVQKEDSKQYGWPICHICGRAYTKLQQHIWYSHNMTKKEYCEKFGIDRNINMTSEEYNKKMHDYALENNMDEQLKEAGKKTRFKKGQDINYERSPMTLERLKETGRTTIHKNRLNNSKDKLGQKRKEALDYINSFDDIIKEQFLKVLNGPVNEMGVEQIKLKCQLLGYDLEKEVKLEEE